MFYNTYVTDCGAPTIYQVYISCALALGSLLSSCWCCIRKCLLRSENQASNYRPPHKRFVVCDSQNQMPAVVPSSAVCNGILSSIFISQSGDNSTFFRSYSSTSPYDTTGIFSITPSGGSSMSYIAAFKSLGDNSTNFPNIESEVTRLLSGLPGWVSDDCAFAMKKYVCMSSFPYPQEKIIRDVFIENGMTESDLNTLSHSWVLQNRNLTLNNVQELLGTSFFSPSYPDRSVCEDYKASCASFFERAKTYWAVKSGALDLAGLRPSCAERGRVQNGPLFNIFPEGNQTVGVLSIKNFDKSSLSLSNRSWTGSFSIFSSPRSGVTFAEAAAATKNTAIHSPTCPTGFVVPFDPSNALTSWVSGTGCAQSCRMPIWTAGEYKALDGAVVDGSAVSLPMLIAAATYWRADSASNRRTRAKNNKNFPTFAAAMVTVGLYAFSMLILSSKPSQQRFCLNNAVPLTQADGMNLCIFSAIVLTYAMLSGSYAWMVLSIDLRSSIVSRGRNSRSVQDLLAAASSSSRIGGVVVEDKNRSWMRMPSTYAKLGFIFLTPLISVLIAYYKGLYGYSGSSSWCSYRSGVSQLWNVGTVYIPGMLAMTIGAACLLHVVYNLAELAMGSSYDWIRRQTRKVAATATAAVAPGAGGELSSMNPTQLRKMLNKDQIGHTILKLFSDLIERGSVSYPTTAQMLAVGLTDSRGGAGGGGGTNNSRVGGGRAGETVEEGKQQEEGGRDGDEGDESSFASTLFMYNPSPLLRAGYLIFAFAVIYTLIWTESLAIRSDSSLHQNKYTASFNEWQDCAFANYDASNPGSWQSICGEHPKLRASFVAMFFSLLSTSLFGAIIVLLYFYSVVTNSCAQSQKLAHAAIHRKFLREQRAAARARNVGGGVGGGGGREVVVALPNAAAVV